MTELKRNCDTAKTVRHINQPFTKDFHGVGIRNTQERLKKMYGDDCSCKFAMAEPSGLIVSIRIPFESEQEG